MKVTIFDDYKEENWPSIQVYTDSLVRNLQRFEGIKMRITRYTAGEQLSQLLGTGRYPRLLFRYGINPVFAPFHQGDINHIVDQSYAHLAFSLDPNKTIITCHDLIVPLKVTKHLERNKNDSKGIRYAFGVMRLSALRRTAKVIAVSETTKNDLVREIGVDEKKIEVIPEGVEPEFRRIKNQKILQDLKQRHKLPHKFVLFVGINKPYKNVDIILRALVESAKSEKLGFVIVGDILTESQRKWFKKKGDTKLVRELGHLPKKELPAMYNLATALVHVSSFEGFGLTLLEAMACGCPVIASDIQPLREVAGNAAIFVDPENVKQIAKAIVKVSTDKRRATELVQEGTLQSRKFTWEETAQKTLKVYNAVYRKRGGT